MNGSFPEQVPIHELSTVGMISVCAATIYNSMMAIYYAYVMVAQSALQQEIKNHLETSAKLRIAMHEAERANEVKAVFLAKMNHQLRTPLNAIIGYSETPAGRLRGERQARTPRNCDPSTTPGRHLLSLVSDVLYMPKIDAENIESGVSPFDLDDCLEEVSATCLKLVSQNGNSFALEKPKELGMIETDETRLRQILINLLGNAGQVHQERQGACCAASRGYEGNREQVVIAVQDTGIGIPPEAIPNLFTDFNQVDAEPVRRNRTGPRRQPQARRSCSTARSRWKVG